jgi:predicted SAM-dependent methyltransferase
MDRLSPSHPLGIKKLHVGCGPHNILTDWWNVDLRSFPGIDEEMDVTESWPWSECLEYVYGEHFIEHLEIDRAFAFLSSANYSLKGGGRIRLTTPSLEWVLSTHFQLNGDLLPKDIINQTLSINRAFYGWGHRFLYSKAMLSALIESAGFTKIQYFEYRQSGDSQLVELEQHGGYRIDSGYPSVWIVEAEKKGEPVQDSLTEYNIHRDFLNHVASGH